MILLRIHLFITRTMTQSTMLLGGGENRWVFTRPHTEHKAECITRQIWETASKAGLMTANLMWPGPPKTSRGISATYFVPWRVCPVYAYQITHVPIIYWIGSCPVAGET